MAITNVTLESEVKVGSLDLYPVVLALVRRDIRGHALSVVMCREALGVVVRRHSEVRAFMVDGRVLTVEELALEHPSLADGLAAIL
jgi:hypothetical protein